MEGKMDTIVTKDGYTISTNKTILQTEVIHQYLSAESYWAANIPISIVEKSIEGSLCFGIYHTATKQQVGFARVVTDNATFAYLADVFVLATHRKKGLSKWLMKTIMQHPNLKTIRRFMLATKDAHELYKKFGFNGIEKPERLMQTTTFTTYNNMDIA
jgi:GNAT superfamily N-acetyltransferase